MTTDIPAGYKLTEVGMIPGDWETVTLGAIGSFGKGQGIRKDQAATGDIPCVRYGELYTRHTNIVRKFYSHISVEVAKTSRLLSKGDLLFAGSGETKEEIGKCAAMLADFPVYAGGDIVVLTPRRGDSSYLGYLANAPEIAKQKASLGQGDAVVHISATALMSVVLGFPPLPEQRTIATALSDVDALLAKLDALIAKKRDLKQATMQQLLTGQTRLPGFSGAWEVRRLGELGNCLRGVTYKGDSDLWPHDNAQTKRLLRSNNVQDATVVVEDIQFVNADRVSPQQLLRASDILICMANGSKALVGKAGLFSINDGYEYAFGAFMGCFRSNTAAYSSSFVFYLFQTGQYRNYINNLLAGSSINNLNPGSIESLEFQIPPLPEQNAIATILTDMDTELAALQTRRDKTHALKQGMMQALLTGRIRLVPTMPQPEGDSLGNSNC